MSKDNKNNKEIAEDQVPIPTTESSLGIEQNVAALLAYLFGIIGGLIFLLTEKNNQFVRFAAAQSIVFNVAIVVIYVVYFILSSIIAALIGYLGVIMLFVTPLAVLGLLAVWVMLMIKAYSNKEWELPVIGKIARSFAK